MAGAAAAAAMDRRLQNNTHKAATRAAKRVPSDAPAAEDVGLAAAQHRKAQRTRVQAAYRDKAAAEAARLAQEQAQLGGRTARQRERRAASKRKAQVLHKKRRGPVAKNRDDARAPRLAA